MAAMTSYHA